MRDLLDPIDGESNLYDLMEEHGVLLYDLDLAQSEWLTRLDENNDVVAVKSDQLTCDYTITLSTAVLLLDKNHFNTEFNAWVENNLAVLGYEGGQPLFVAFDDLEVAQEIVLKSPHSACIDLCRHH